MKRAYNGGGMTHIITKLFHHAYRQTHSIDMTDKHCSGYTVVYYVLKFDAG